MLTARRRRAVVTRGRTAMRAIAAVAFVALTAVAVLAGCAAPGAGGGNSLGASHVPQAALARVGDFDMVTDGRAVVDPATALDKSRAEGFGRPGAPEASLVRARSDSPENPDITKGRLLWIFHWDPLARSTRRGSHRWAPGRRRGPPCS